VRFALAKLLRSSRMIRGRGDWLDPADPRLARAQHQHDRNQHRGAGVITSGVGVGVTDVQTFVMGTSSGTDVLLIEGADTLLIEGTDELLIG
jgi:hypothetical protein